MTNLIEFVASNGSKLTIDALKVENILIEYDRETWKTVVFYSEARERLSQINLCFTSSKEEAGKVYDQAVAIWKNGILGNK